MRLTLICAKYRPEFIGYIPKFRGNVTKGVHRYVPKVTLSKKLILYRQMRVEEEVMKCLSIPYITQTQEEAYLKSVGRTRPEYWDDFLRRPIETPLKQDFAADYLKKLDISRSFEEED